MSEKSCPQCGCPLNPGALARFCSNECAWEFERHVADDPTEEPPEEEEEEVNGNRPSL